ncbi:hypothetical protein [Eubacterium xylanophilum]|uniref:hypothetical protein n=1 Tax=Eubacterium xylanophilum TaxID=39497 RepID=UPI000478F316|nr:hypothetical protein [Eubacterium xylanophilum]
MTKKKEYKTYEYFKVDEVFFWGKHKDYVDKLWTKNKIQESYFARLVDLYAVAAIIGLKLKKRSPEVKDDTDNKRTVQMQQLNNNYQTLLPIMRMVLILDDSRNLSFEEKLESAFRIPEDEKTYKENMELFNSYARGGIEFLYEKLVLRTPDIDEDYSDYRIANMVSLISNPIIEEI